ncbi:GDSL esterase/lipase At4g01130-like isoform X2 [Macadamia integrifolia]|uniref:GDSL esterase/lipase At4g01130-like isoform X2 n=1 Tax=Macadamia integrifolia TaxID=60698 RepID=UPI001C4E5724|nr:GDSL esterase/lipase At4g01130-like isoform X2 [Macadamia integrifolia]
MAGDSIHSFMLFFLATTLLLSNSVSFTVDRLFSSGPPPSIFVFGDSLSDTGNAVEAYSFYNQAEKSPYGSTFFHSPSGRFSDGRLIIDFLTSKWGLPFLQPYFSNIAPNYRHGINFAVGGATAQNITDPVVFFLHLQINHFLSFKHKVYSSLNAKHISRCAVSHVPPVEAFNNGLYVICIGSNDFLRAILRDNLTPTVVKQKTVPLDLHKEGAMNFLVFNFPAFGCTPLALTLGSMGPFNSTDQFGCLQVYNAVVDFANVGLEKSLHVLSNKFSNIHVALVDFQKFTFDVAANPEIYGFRRSEKFKACCGYGGGPYNYNPLISCGKNAEAKACSNPREYTSWDGLHPTDAFNQRFVEELTKGTHYRRSIGG